MNLNFIQVAISRGINMPIILPPNPINTVATGNTPTNPTITTMAFGHVIPNTTPDQLRQATQNGLLNNPTNQIDTRQIETRGTYTDASGATRATVTNQATGITRLVPNYVGEFARSEGQYQSQGIVNYQSPMNTPQVSAAPSGFNLGQVNPQVNPIPAPEVVQPIQQKFSSPNAPIGSQSFMRGNANPAFIGQRQQIVNHFDEPQSESKPSFSSGRNAGFRTLPVSIANAVRAPIAINQSSGNPQNAFNRNAFNQNVNNTPNVANQNIGSALGYRQPMLANTKPAVTKSTFTVTNKRIVL